MSGFNHLSGDFFFYFNVLPHKFTYFLLDIFCWNVKLFQFSWKRPTQPSPSRRFCSLSLHWLRTQVNLLLSQTTNLVRPLITYVKIVFLKLEKMEIDRNRRSPTAHPEQPRLLRATLTSQARHHSSSQEKPRINVIVYL